MRTATVTRKTNETDIKLFLNLDGNGKNEIDTGCGFMNHMLELFSKHGHFDLNVTCKGDVNVDYHHTVEDIGISLGKAFSEALGDKKGIKRYGNMILPMDEALILSAVDISGRSYLVYDLDIPSQLVGDFDTELIEEFFIAFSKNANLTLNVKKLDGRNSHHIIEGAFKSVARSLKTACEIDKDFADEVPSTKGVL